MIKEFIKNAIASSQSYYEFLVKNKRGCEEISIRKIDIEHDLVKLHLNKKLFDMDSIEFLISGKKYTAEQIKINDYDRDENILYINYPVELNINFNLLTSGDIKIISDLKFLVRRVEEWYKNYGSTISFPEHIQQIIEPTPFEENCSFSDAQANAIENIFLHPFTYVWGAPGSGKTRYVLSYSILRYIAADKKVAVLAPTNNALEQILWGLLEVLQKEGVDTNKVLRLGIPSRNFAEKYPETCEVAGINKIISESKEQVIRLKKAIEFKEYEKRRESFAALPDSIENIKNMMDEYYERINDKRVIEAALFQKDNEIDKLIQERESLQEGIKNIECKMSTISFKILSIFIPQMKSNNAINLHHRIETLNSINNQFNISQEERNVLQMKKAELSNVIQEKRTLLERLISDIQIKIADSNKLRILSEDLNISTFSKKCQEIEDIIKKGDNNYLMLKERYSQYAVSVEDLQKKVSILEEKIKELENKSTEQRLKEVQVIALTVDGFVGRFSPLDNDGFRYNLNVSHVFMDEAGYCNLIKGMTLLSLNCPLTFLGDHMQLPPVCEMNDEDFKKSSYSNVFLWAQSALYAESVFSRKIDELREMYLSSHSAEFVRIKKTDLNKTFRFGNNLAKVLDGFIYKNGFHSEKENAEMKLTVIDAKRRNDGSKKRENTAEAERIRDIIEQNSFKNYAILSPYNDQVKLLQRILPKPANELRIMTVHSSQGKEWDEVIFSVSDTSDMWFTDSKKKKSKGKQIVNTAVSRTKKHLIIVCDYDFWIDQREQLIGELVAIADDIS